MAFAFNGTSDAISASFTPPSLPFSMGCMFRPNNIGTAEIIMAIGTDNARYHIQTNNVNAGYLLARVVNGSGNPYAETTGAFATGNWYSVIAVFTSTTSRAIYISQLSAGTDTTSASVSPASQLDIGARTASSAFGGFFSGRIAEVAVWNAALGAGDALEMYVGKPPSRIRPANLVFYAPLIRNATELKGGTSLTVTGATPDSHHGRRGK